jgi:nucleoside-diphosphate-sugar epimerase
VRVLCTGGAGFIGSHLCEALLAQGDTVLALDDLSTGSTDNLSAIRDHPCFEFVQGSVVDRDLVGDLVDSADVVAHLASPVGVKVIVDHPLKSLETMIHGTEAVLDAAVRRHAKVLVASTSEVYGKNVDLLHEDADRVLGPTSIPRWAYATAKAVDEFLAIGYWRERAVPTVVVRFFNTVGPRQSAAYGMVLPRFVTRALEGEDLVVYGDGMQRRCFCHVDDSVRAVAGLLDASGAIGRTFNVASNEETTILGLARRVIALTGSSSSIRFEPYEAAYGGRSEDMVRRVPDTTRIESLLGWSAVNSLNQAIADLADSLRPAGLDRPKVFSAAS